MQSHLVFFRQKRLQDYKKEKNFLQIQSGRKRFRQNQLQGKNNTYFGIQQTLNLVNFINKDEPEKICSGIGMQSHVDIKVPTIELYGAALEKFLAAGYEVQITELDVTINYDTNGSYSYADEKETNADQAKYVGQLMKTILEKNRSRDKNVNPKGVTSITLWGLYDTISWRASRSPLLFDTGITDPKASFYEFINAAKSMG